MTGIDQLTAGVVGTPYSFAFTASGSPAPTFTLVTPNSQPTGLSLSTAGVLSGTPSAAGTFTFAVQASNSAGTAVSPLTGTHGVVIGPAVGQTGAVLADISGNVIPRPVSRAAKAILAPHAGLNGGNTISGQEWRGWYNRNGLPRPAHTPVGLLTARSKDGKQWAIRFQPTAASAYSSCDFHAALLGCDLNSDVKWGENRGRKLEHDFVVLVLADAGSIKHGDSFQSELALKSSREKL